MGREKEIEHMHCGRVVRIEGRRLWVSIAPAPSSGCAGCTLSANCGNAGASATMEVPVLLAEGRIAPAPGAEVRLSCAVSVGKSVSLLFGAPLAALVGGMVGISLAGGSELASLGGGAAFCALAFAVVRAAGRRAKIWQLVNS